MVMETSIVAWNAWLIANNMDQAGLQGDGELQHRPSYRIVHTREFQRAFRNSLL